MGEAAGMASRLVDDLEAQGADEERLVDYVDYVEKDKFLRVHQPREVRVYAQSSALLHMLRYRSTVFRMVIRAPEFYLLILLHTLLLVAFRLRGRLVASNGEVVRLSDGRPRSHWPRIHNELFTVLSSLLVFLLVFYNNQAYKRYMEQFFVARFIESRMRFMTLRLRAFFRRQTFPAAEQSMRAIFRSMLVAHYSTYFRLPRYVRHGVDKWGWNYLRQCRLITAEEMQSLEKKTGPQIFAEAMAFSTEVLAEHLRQGHISSEVYGFFQEDFQFLARYIMTVTTYANHPVPFAYYHLATMLTAMMLILQAYSFAFYDTFFSIVVYALLCLVILGLRGLSGALADPFGTDDVDFQTILPTARTHRDLEDILDRDSIFGGVKVKSLSESRKQHQAEVERHTGWAKGGASDLLLKQLRQMSSQGQVRDQPRDQARE
ncbi:hypothetical protein CBR_g19632 [Chara braunii]|uniref:Uncharacterized protein n=1 Tax=Chara braunii TaxID=69332 RepID=A0A388KYJ1_CHABU|nr:hypothetical protein CBR_g19632 [Chara braunii]|eukprot:GBG75119.1 hypothetical protein CBR_g19632 [Chara braunii]